MDNEQKHVIALDSQIDINSNDMLVPISAPKFSFNRQRLLGNVLQNSVRYERDGWFAGWYTHNFDLLQIGTFNLTPDNLGSYTIDKYKTTGAGTQGFTVNFKEEGIKFSFTTSGWSKWTSGNGIVSRVDDTQIRIQGTTSAGDAFETIVDAYDGHVIQHYCANALLQSPTCMLNGGVYNYNLEKVFVPNVDWMQLRYGRDSALTGESLVYGYNGSVHSFGFIRMDDASGVVTSTNGQYIVRGYSAKTNQLDEIITVDLDVPGTYNFKLEEIGFESVAYNGALYGSTWGSEDSNPGKILNPLNTNTPTIHLGSIYFVPRQIGPFTINEPRQIPGWRLNYCPYQQVSVNDPNTDYASITLRWSVPVYFRIRCGLKLGTTVSASESNMGTYRNGNNNYATFVNYYQFSAVASYSKSGCDNDLAVCREEHNDYVRFQYNNLAGDMRDNNFNFPGTQITQGGSSMMRIDSAAYVPIAKHYITLCGKIVVQQLQDPQNPDVMVDLMKSLCNVWSFNTYDGNYSALAIAEFDVDLIGDWTTAGTKQMNIVLSNGTVIGTWYIAIYASGNAPAPDTRNPRSVVIMNSLWMRRGSDVVETDVRYLYCRGSGDTYGTYWPEPTPLPNPRWHLTIDNNNSDTSGVRQIRVKRDTQSDTEYAAQNIYRFEYPITSTPSAPVFNSGSSVAINATVNVTTVGSFCVPNHRMALYNFSARLSGSGVMTYAEYTNTYAYKNRTQTYTRANGAVWVGPITHNRYNFPNNPFYDTSYNTQAKLSSEMFADILPGGAQYYTPFPATGIAFGKGGIIPETAPNPGPWTQDTISDCRNFEVSETAFGGTSVTVATPNTLRLDDIAGGLGIIRIGVYKVEKGQGAPTLPGPNGGTVPIEITLQLESNPGLVLDAFCMTDKGATAPVVDDDDYGLSPIWIREHPNAQNANFAEVTNISANNDGGCLAVNGVGILRYYYHLQSNVIKTVTYSPQNKTEEAFCL